MFYESVMARVMGVRGVRAVAELGDSIRIIASDDVDYEEIESAVGDLDYDVAVVAERSSRLLDRFVAESRFHEYRGRAGQLRHAGEARMLQARAGLLEPPITNVAIADEIGLLFASVADKEAFVAWTVRR